MTTAKRLTADQLKLLASLQTGLNAAEELGVMNGDQVCDLFGNCLSALGIDYDEYCEQ